MRRMDLIAIVAMAVALASCGNDAPDQTPTDPKPAKLLTISKASTQRSNSLPAVIRSVRTTDLAFQVGGQITEWNAIDGAEFRRGDVIARLDARAFQASVAQAEAQYRNADSEYQRAARLIEEDAISRSVVESRDAQRQIAKASLDTAKKNLSDTVLRAPFNGSVGRTNVEQFQNVAPQQPVLVLQSRAVEAIVNVPASFVLNSNRVRYFNTFIELDAAPGRRFAATFREALAQADSSTQTFEGHFSFTPPADLVVLTGMTATLFFETEVLETEVTQSGVSVPLAAILAEGKTKYVWVVKGRDRVLERRNVTVAPGVGEMMIVTDGLKEGDTIVEAGGAYLQEGERVRPWEK
ncbi:MAG: efflux RND transporter periplasmic adaptor subunit [Pseudomonadota bacterium]|nr:efflux RND transporter periplasmic adaptor subunit [Pseudomonadota bacterium]